MDLQSLNSISVYFTGMLYGKYLIWSEFRSYCNNFEFQMQDQIPKKKRKEKEKNKF